MSNSVVHFEILGKDAKKTQEFYSKLFGWQIDSNNPVDYGLVKPGTGGIGGGIGETPPGKPPMVSFYVGVDDVDASLKKAESLGGKTIVPKTVIPGMVTYAMFVDPDGLPIGLILNEMPK